MALALKLNAIEDLPRTPASDVKKLGWRGVMKTIARTGRVVVTNHSQPEAVILSVKDYDAIMHALQQASANDDALLETLHHRFDERLASLQDADAGTRLRNVMKKPAKLHGKVKAGTSH